MDEVRDVGRKICELRNQFGETQEQAAEAAGISQVALARYESGQRMPKLDILHRLAKHYYTTIDALIGETDDTPEDEAEAELWAYREAVRRDPERRILFSLAKDADIREVRQAVAIIDALKKGGEKG